MKREGFVGREGEEMRRRVMGKGKARRGKADTGQPFVTLTRD